MGGIERALSVLANYFSDKGFKVSFISCLSGERFYKLNNNIDIIEPESKRGKGIMNALLFYPSIILFIRKTVLRINPSTVLAFGDWFSPLVLFALYGTNYPVYISDRTSPDYKFKFPIPQLKKIFYPTSAGFIAQTKRAAGYKRIQFKNKLNIKIIPNAIREVKIFPEIKRQKIILYVGRFAWEKGPERLIKAFGCIKEKNGWELHMAGSGPLLEPMKKLAIELGLEKEIKFFGKVENVDELYAKASIYVLPSVLEGFPNSLCEAMACGLPVVCFDTIPYEDILTDGFDGIVAKSTDAKSLSNSIELLMNSDEIRKKIGENAIKIKNRLSADIIGNNTLNFIFSDKIS